MICSVIDIGMIPYGEALFLQSRAVDKLQSGVEEETLFLLEHPPVFTAGRNFDHTAIIGSKDLLKEKGVELFETDRGGNVTFHGPGQLIGYPILSLEPQRRDIGRYVRDLEEVLIRTLASFSIDSCRHEKHRGVWIEGRKIASVGVRISRWVTSHGFALNVTTDLSYFSLIHPCGIKACRMTTMQEELGEAPDIKLVKKRIIEHFASVFGRELTAGSVDGNKMRNHVGQ